MKSLSIAFSASTNNFSLELPTKPDAASLKDKIPFPSVFRIWSAVPSAAGNVKVTSLGCEAGACKDVLFVFVGSLSNESLLLLMISKAPFPAVVTAVGLVERVVQSYNVDV